MYIDNFGSEVMLGLMDGSEGKAVGRTGDGPGEYKHVSRLASCGTHGFVVADVVGNRLLYYRWDGHFDHQVQVRYQIAAIDCGIGGITAVVQQPAPLPRFGAENANILTTLHFWSWDRTLADSLVGIDAGEFRVLGSVYQFSVIDGVLAVGSGRTASLALSDIGTREAKTLEVGIPNRPPTESIYSAAIDRLVSGLADEAERAHWRSVFGSMPMPKSMPAFYQLESGSDKYLWVVISPPGSGGIDIAVFDSTTREMMGTVRLQGRSQLIAVGSHNFITRGVDDASGSENLFVYSWSVR